MASKATTMRVQMKLPLKRARNVAACFNDNNSSGDENEVMFLTKKPTMLTLEDKNSKSKRLQEEGIILAESNRYWEAVRRWTDALELTPDQAVLHELKAQALLELDQVFPAMLSAEKAVLCDCTWSPALQTLGRAQLGTGEIFLALRNFEKAVHLDPANEELRQEDLKWACELCQQHKLREERRAESAESSDHSTRTEEEEDC